MFIYELPSVGGGKGVLNGIVGGWQVSGILTAQSGSALTVTQPSGIPQSRPDVVSGTDLMIPDWRSTCGATGCSYLNPAAFAAVPISSVTNATLRPGTYKVGQARGPGSWNLNMTIAKSFTLIGAQKLQVRADVFNALNTKNWNGPTLGINSPEFGRITGAAPARSAQVGARWTF